MANGITDAVLEEVKARIELSDLVASYGVAVKSAGASKKACCPFHNEKTPSFNINDRKGFYHCFGCGETGDAIKFVMKMEGLTFIEAVKKLAGQCGVKVEEKEDPDAGQRKRLYTLMAELAAFYHRCLLKMKEAELAREYLKTRDLNDQVQEDFLIGYAPKGIAPMLTWAEKYGFTPKDLAAAGVIKPPTDSSDRGYHRFGGRLMFTIRDKQGRVVAFSGRQLVSSKNSGKYVNSPETLIFKKSNVLFGFDKAAGNIAKSAHHEAIVCEGQIDTIRLHICGFPRAMASQGTAFTEEHVKMVKKVADQAVLVFDDDDAGHKATIRTAGLFLAAQMPVRVVSLPNGDDPDSFLRTHPAEDFQRLLDDAESIMSFQVRVERAKEKAPDSIDAVNRVTKAVLATVAQASSAVIRASMVGEAAKLLNLPTAALNEELEKTRTSRTAMSRPVIAPSEPSDEEVEDFTEEPEALPEDEAPLAGEDARAIVPPPPREMAFMQFLMANEYDATLDGMTGEFLPSEVFAHPFTARFVEAWRAEVASGQDVLKDFASNLSGHERAWFDTILLKADLSQACGESTTKSFKRFVCSLWADSFQRKRGELPAHGTRETDALRMRLSVNLKALPEMSWSEVKDMIRQWCRSK